MSKSDIGKLFMGVASAKGLLGIILDYDRGCYTVHWFDGGRVDKTTLYAGRGHIEAYEKYKKKILTEDPG